MYPCDLTHLITPEIFHSLARHVGLPVNEEDRLKLEQYSRHLLYQTHVEQLFYIADYLKCRELPDGVECVDDPLDKLEGANLASYLARWPAVAAISLMLRATTEITTVIYAKVVQKALEDTYLDRLDALRDFSCGKAYADPTAVLVRGKETSTVYRPQNLDEVCNRLLTESIRSQGVNVYKMLNDVNPYFFLCNAPVTE